MRLNKNTVKCVDNYVHKWINIITRPARPTQQTQKEVE